MSLPLVMPPLRRDEHVWTDAVWVKDANVTEALRRGADEVWLVWCIGNSPYWGDGPLEQYVHMIEMSANGALFAELDAARAAGRSFRLHVVRPMHPLPLDSELYAGRISTDTLMAMGYRDAWDYLDQPRPDGVAAGRHLHRDDRAAGRRPAVTERLRGEVGDEDLTLHVTAELPLDERWTPDRPGVVGHVDHAPWGGRVLLAGGRLELTGPDARLPGAGPGRRPVGGRRGGPRSSPTTRASTPGRTRRRWHSARAAAESGDAASRPARRRPRARLGRAGRRARRARPGRVRSPGSARTGLRRVLTTYGT